MELNIPAIHGVGMSRFYFVDRYDKFSIYDVDFVPIPTVDPHPPAVAGMHFFGIVQYIGNDRTEDWIEFYRRLLGFTDLPPEQPVDPTLDSDGDGVPEVKMQDWSYAYEFTCFAGSYAPEIVLRFVNDHYVIAPDLMETPAWTEEELADKAAEILAAYREVDAEGAETLLSPSDWGAGDGELWNAMLELIYAGHEDQALQLFNLAWPEWAEGRESALQHFSETVGASPYWQQLVAEPGQPVE